VRYDLCKATGTGGDACSGFNVRRINTTEYELDANLTQGGLGLLLVDDLENLCRGTAACVDGCSHG
jgi:hypothetical protein